MKKECVDKIEAMRALGCAVPAGVRPRRRHEQARPNSTTAPIQGPDARFEQIAAALGLTTRRVKASDVAGMEPLFVRVYDLQLLAGIKRGEAYRKIKDKTFKSISLREPGKKFGVRLVFWPSVKNALLALLAEQNPEA